jgi:hypothetical protein
MNEGASLPDFGESCSRVFRRKPAQPSCSPSPRKARLLRDIIERYRYVIHPEALFCQMVSKPGSAGSFQSWNVLSILIDKKNIYFPRYILA